MQRSEQLTTTRTEYLGYLGCLCYLGYLQYSKLY